MLPFTVRNVNPLMLKRLKVQPSLPEAVASPSADALDLLSATVCRCCSSSPHFLRHGAITNQPLQLFFCLYVREVDGFLNVMQWEKHQWCCSVSKSCRSRKSGNPRLVFEITEAHVRLPVWQPNKHTDSCVILFNNDELELQCSTVSVWQTDRERREMQTVWLAEINQQDIRITSFHRFKFHSELFNCAWRWAVQYIKRHVYALEAGCTGTLHLLALFVQLAQEKRSCWTK